MDQHTIPTNPALDRGLSAPSVLASTRRAAAFLAHAGLPAAFRPA